VKEGATPEQVYGWTVKEADLFLTASRRRRVEAALAIGWAAAVADRWKGKLPPLQEFLAALLPPEGSAGPAKATQTPEQQRTLLLLWAEALGGKIPPGAWASNPARN